MNITAARAYARAYAHVVVPLIGLRKNSNWCCRYINKCSYIARVQFTYYSYSGSRKKRKNSTTKSIADRIKGVLHCGVYPRGDDVIMSEWEKIETPGDVSIFLVNGEKKNSGSLLLGSQFELFTSSVEPTNECGICPSCIPEVINLTVFFLPVPDQYLFIFLRIILVLRRCSSLLFYFILYFFFMRDVYVLTAH